VPQGPQKPFRALLFISLPTKVNVIWFFDPISTVTRCLIFTGPFSTDIKIFEARLRKIMNFEETRAWWHVFKFCNKWIILLQPFLVQEKKVSCSMWPLSRDKHKERRFQEFSNNICDGLKMALHVIKWSPVDDAYKWTNRQFHAEPCCHPRKYRIVVDLISCT